MTKKHTHQKGATLVLFVLLLSVLIALMGLALDGGYMLLQKARLQSTADASALACVINSSTCGAGGSNIFPAVNPHNFNVQTTNPVSCPLSTQSSCAKAIASATWTPFIIGFLGANNVNLSASAISGKSSSSPCVSTKQNITMSGGAIINAPICSINAGNNLSLSGGALITSNQIVYGNSLTISGGASTSSTPTKSISAFQDPFGSTTLPSLVAYSNNGTCTNCSGSSCSGGKTCIYSSGTFNSQVSVSGGATATLSPGIYNGGIALSGGATINFQPGIYAIQGGQLSLSGGTVSNGNGVSFYFSGSSAVNISGGATTNLYAPTSTQVASTGGINGMIFWQAASDNAAVNISGGSATILAGNMYLPNANLSLSGGRSVTKPYGTIIANSLTTSGGNTIYIVNTYGASGVGGNGKPILVQ